MSDVARYDLEGTVTGPSIGIVKDGQYVEHADYAALAGQNELARTALSEACSLYCRWYDTGYPSMDGSAMAYELVSFIRQALANLSPEAATKAINDRPPQ